MGCFTTICDPAQNLSVQIYTGDDVCGTFSVGDTIPWQPNPFYPGEHVDGVYEGLAGEGPKFEDYFVVIKDCKVLAVVPKGPPAEFDDLDPAYILYKQYGIQPPDPSLWTAEQWEERQQREDKYKAEAEEFRKSIAHLTGPERLMAVMTKPIRERLDWNSIGRQCFLVKEIKEDKAQ